MADVPIDPIGAARRLDTILGRTDLPYTYTDEDDVALRVDRGVCTAYDRPGRASVSFYAPKGEDAVRLAHAVLAAAGHTGHIVVSTEDSARAIRIRESVAAEDMRERAIEALGSPQYAAAAIRALPLLPGSDEAHPVSAYRDPDMWETTPDGERIADRDPDPGFARGWTAGIAHANSQQLPDGEVPCPSLSPTSASTVPYGCEGSAGHSGDHHARQGDVTWGNTAPATVHVATPECITPCGKGHHDATVTAFIPEVSCVECLRATAIQKSDQVIEVRRERDRLRTAWESARRGRTQARAQLADARRYVRILDEQRAAREVTGAEEIGQIVDDSVEIGAQSMREWVERLDRELSGVTQAVTKRLADVENHLGITDDTTPEEPPARYRDRDGDLWEQAVTGRYRLIEWSDGRSAPWLTRTLDALRDGYGPLTPVTTTPEPAPCETCGRPYAEQEHGPDGKCRHTPATRLGRPTT